MEYRKATMADTPAIHHLINDYAQQGLMLRRPLGMLFEDVRDFWVAEDEGGQVLGTVALHVVWQDLAEVRSLAVAPPAQGQQVGRRLVEHCMAEALGLGIRRVFALTYQQAFFERCGFTVVKKEELPQKVWKECVYCDKFFSCDEVAMVRIHADVPVPVVNGGQEIPLVDKPLWVVE